MVQIGVLTVIVVAERSIVLVDENGFAVAELAIAVTSTVAIKLEKMAFFNDA